MSNPFQSADPWEVSTERILPDGNHVVEIKEAVVGTSSGGHPQVELLLCNKDGQIRDWLVVTDASVGKVVALAQAAGVELPTDEDIVEGLRLKQSYVDQFFTKMVGIVVRDEPSYKDPTVLRPRVQGYVDPARIKPSDVTPPTAGAAFATAGANRNDPPPF